MSVPPLLAQHYTIATRADPARGLAAGTRIVATSDFELEYQVQELCPAGWEHTPLVALPDGTWTCVVRPPRAASRPVEPHQRVDEEAARRASYDSERRNQTQEVQEVVAARACVIVCRCRACAPASHPLFQH
ncbi:MAG: hypothetical protein Q7V62_03725 [Actinomycetota bacterium]|nr:hypothetical protein [Actinomycetota bacterium]